MKEDSFVFCTSWLEAIEELEEKDQLATLKAILRYQAYHEEPKVTGTPKAIFKIAKKTADIIHARKTASRENGKKGGRPKNLEKPNHNLEKPYGYGNGYGKGNGYGNGKSQREDIDPKYDDSENPRLDIKRLNELLEGRKA